MAAALGFTAVTLLKNARMKHQGAAALGSPSPTASPLLAGTANPVPTSISSPHAPLVSTTPVSSPPAPLVSPTPAPSPPATPILRPSASARGAVPKEAKTPPEAARKLAEHKRRDAERKRARLEILYKDHQISEEAYKQGQEEYQAEMAKYRNVVPGGHPTNQSQ
jgi:hypothetical protein